MDAQAFKAIETKIRQQRSAMGSQPSTEVPIDWPAPQGVKVHSSAVRAAETVDMLQRRSRQSGGVSAVGADRNGFRAPVNHRRANPTAHRRRMVSMAQHINDLSLAQEQAIADMQRAQQQFAAQFPEILPPGQPAINFDQAVTAWAKVDAAGWVVLSHRPVSPLPNHEAHALAQHLRQTYGVPQGRRSGARWLGPRLRQGKTWIAEVITAWGGHRDNAPLPAPTTTEALLWAGAGVVGRLMMQGLITAIPGLGGVAVVACLASLSLVLYRAILPPSPDIYRMLRVGLALAGLLIGGYLI